MLRKDYTMADNDIPFSALEKKPLNTRIYALVKLYQAAERMEFLNEGQKNKEELARISDAVVAFVNSAMGGDKDKDATNSEAVIDQFPELMDLILSNDNEEKQSFVRDFMETHKDIAFVSTSNFKLIATGDTDQVKLTKTLDEINAIVLETAQSQKSTYTAKELAQSITDSSIDNEERQKKLQIVLKNLQQIKKSIQTRIVADWQVYKASEAHNLDAISEDVERITGRVDVSYKTKSDGKKIAPKGQPIAPSDLTPKQKALRRVRGHFSETSARQYNRDYPETKIAVKPQSKEDFLSIMGTFMQNGYSQYFALTSSPSEAGLSTLKKKVENLYSDNSENALNRILNIKNPEKLSPQELEMARVEAFNLKSKEIFVKTLCAGISAKRESAKNRSVPPEFIKNNLLLYIREMAANGTNNIMHLATLDENAASWKDVADSKKEKYEGKIATVHHHRPIASTIDFYLALHPEEIKNGETLDTMSEQRLRQLADKAEKLANNLGNHCLVFGADVHDSMEANGFYSVSDVKDNTVLACRYDVETIKNELKMMKLSPIASQSEKIKDALLKDIEKYSKNKDKNGIVRTAIDFPDHTEVEALRERISKQKSEKNSLDIGQLLSDYVADMPR